MMMKTILALGDTVAPYHPISNLYALREALSGFEMTITDDHAALLRVKEFDLCLCYLDSWEEPLSAEQSGALKQALWDGGKLLYLHSGICLYNTPELAEVLGARFDHHPEREDITVSPVPGHPVTEGLPSFTVYDEPYHYERSGPARVFATYEYHGVTMPAAWESDYGRGTLIHLMPGHDEKVFQCEGYQTWIRRCAEYLCSK